jgi:hypothetical protein
MRASFHPMREQCLRTFICHQQNLMWTSIASLTDPSVDLEVHTNTHPLPTTLVLILTKTNTSFAHSNRKRPYPCSLNSATTPNAAFLCPSRVHPSIQILRTYMGSTEWSTNLSKHHPHIQRRHDIVLPQIHNKSTHFRRLFVVPAASTVR